MTTLRGTIACQYGVGEFTVGACVVIPVATPMDISNRGIWITERIESRDLKATVVAKMITPEKLFILD